MRINLFNYLIFEFGKRIWETEDFKFFYCPLIKSSKKEGRFVLFWWFGRNSFVALRKTKR